MKMSITDFTELSNLKEIAKALYMYDPPATYIAMAIGILIILIMVIGIVTFRQESADAHNNHGFVINMALIYGFFMTTLILGWTVLEHVLVANGTGYYQSEPFTVKTTNVVKDETVKDSVSKLKVTPKTGETFVITPSKDFKLEKNRTYTLKTDHMLFSNKDKGTVNISKYPVTATKIN